MRHILTSLVLVILLFPSLALGETVKSEDLVFRDGLYYKGFTDVPFSGTVGPPPKKWSTAIVSKRRIRNGEQTSQTRRNSDEVTAG